MDAQLAPASPQTIVTTAWHSLSEGDTLAALSVEDARGLSASEAQARLQTFGSNELTEAPRPTFWARLLAQFKNFLIIILIVASVISLLLGDYAEAIAIMAIVLLNAILGVVQESRAEEALAALKKMAAPEAQVIRDESSKTIPATRAGARRHRVPRNRQLRAGRRAPAGGGQPQDRRGQPHRRVGAGGEERRRHPRRKRLAGRPEEQRLHQHHRHLWPRARHRRRHRHADADRQDRRDDPELREGADASAAQARRTGAHGWASGRWRSAPWSS